METSFAKVMGETPQPLPSPERVAELAARDQLIADGTDTIASLTWAAYRGFTEKGFTEMQALELAKVYLMQMVRNSKKM